MYPGWMQCGHGDPLEGGEWMELVNNSRAYAYAEQADICWLQPCLDCPEALVVVPGGGDYVSPKLDPAPWYDPEDPDSEGFLGVIGLDVDGAESSTLQATVTMALTGGGVIGPPYHGPRTLVLRALLIATDECSLQFGLNHVRELCGGTADVCVGDSLAFFDCCPCICDDPTPGGPCWADDYRELRLQPDCVLDPRWARNYGELKTGVPDSDHFPTWPQTYASLTTGNADADCWPTNYFFLREGPPCLEADSGAVWWPDTYLELRTGPPPGDPNWCVWPLIYRRLRLGPASWSCCVDACVVPYVRQYHHVRITEGPIMLRHPVMHTSGALAEIELTLVAADPVEQGVVMRATTFEVNNPVPVPVAMMAMAEPAPDPFDVPGVTTLSGIALLTQQPAPIATLAAEAQWVRGEQTMWPSPYGNVLSSQAPIIAVAANGDDAAQVRVGVWIGDERIAGWSIPFIPAHTTVTIDCANRQAYALTSTGTRSLANFVRDWDGGVAEFPRLPHGQHRVTIDQQEGAEVRLIVDVLTSPVAG